MSHTILMIGAGKSGRGFLPQYVDSKDHILFIDKDKILIEKMKASKSYEITFYGNTKPAKKICNYQAYDATQENYQFCLSQCDMVAVSIGLEHYEELANNLKPYCHLLKDKAIVTFENGIDAASRLQRFLGVEDIQISEGSIFCTTNTINEIDIISQDICYLPIKNKALDQIYLENITPIDDFHLFMERKLYTYNLLSALFCYPGYLKGYKLLHEAALDIEIRKDAETLMQSLNPILADYFHVSLHDQQVFSQGAIDKFSNPYIQDSIQRNCRDVKRKLDANERFMKPFVLLHQAQKDLTILLKSIAAALVYDEIEESKQGIHLLETMEIDDNFSTIIKEYYRDDIQKSCNKPLQEADFEKK